MTEKPKASKSTIALSVILSLAMITLVGFSMVFFNTNKQLKQTNASLADMTAKQETTAATLAATEAALTETQAALADMTAKQETTAATLATTEAALTETQAALADMTAKQKAETAKTVSIHDIDLSGLSMDDLAALKSKIDLTVWESEDWQAVTVPQGVWKVGEDIPAGYWTVTCAPKWFLCSLWWSDCLGESGQEISCDGTRNDYEGIFNPNDPEYEEGYGVTSYSFEVRNGDYIVIEDGAAVFSPYAGKPSLGFK